MRYGIDGTAREQSGGEGVGEQTRAGRGQLGHRRTDGERAQENRRLAQSEWCAAVLAHHYSMQTPTDGFWQDLTGFLLI